MESAFLMSRNDLTNKANSASHEAEGKYHFNKDVIKRIKEIQSLPEDVVIEFLKAGGAFKKNKTDTKKQN